MNMSWYDHRGHVKEEKKTYCLGYTHPKCQNCLNQKNWLDINKLDYNMFQSEKSKMHRILDDECRLTEMLFYKPIKEKLDV